MTNTDQVSTFDHWTSIAHKSYLGVTCHAILRWKLAAWVIGIIHVTKRHTAENIKTDISKVLYDWGIYEKKTKNLSCFDKETSADVWKFIETLCEEESRNVEPIDIEDDVQVHDWEQNDDVDDVEAQLFISMNEVDRYRKVKQNMKADPLEFW